MPLSARQDGADQGDPGPPNGPGPISPVHGCGIPPQRNAHLSTCLQWLPRLHTDPDSSGSVRTQQVPPAMHQAQHKKLMEVTEDCKNQVVQVRRQMVDVELAAMEKISCMERDLKDALRACDDAEMQLKLQADNLSLKLTQA